RRQLRALPGQGRWRGGGAGLEFLPRSEPGADQDPLLLRQTARDLDARRGAAADAATALSRRLAPPAMQLAQQGVVIEGLQEDVVAVAGQGGLFPLGGGDGGHRDRS